MRKPLQGVTVVDIGSYVSGPFAAMMLGDLGADVIKIEPPRGDPFRRFGRPDGLMSAEFANVNRGKRSLVLDLKTTAGREHLLEVCGTADVLVSNWRPGVADRLRLSDDALAARNERLVRIYVSGYGSTGPAANDPTYDSVIQARSSLSWIQGAGGTPTMVVGFLVDKVVAVMATQAALAALVERERTGCGTRLDVPMLDAISYFDFPDLLARRTFTSTTPDDPLNGLTASMRPIKASDGWLLVCPVSATQVRQAFVAIEHPDWADALLTARDRRPLAERVLDQLETVTRTGPASHWLERFRECDVPAGRFLDIDEHLEDVQVVACGLYDVADWPELGPTRRVRYPASSASWGLLFGQGPPPLLPESQSTPTASPVRIVGSS